MIYDLAASRDEARRRNPGEEVAMRSRSIKAFACSVSIMAFASPVFAQTATPDDTTGAPAEAAPSDDIVVTGIRQSLSSAQNIKANSDAIVDALVAEDIGKFPDNNAAEAIARVTGVQVTRYGDEANGVLIRGLPNVQTTVQGREIFTADGRSVSIQDFPAQALSKVEVYKGRPPTTWKAVSPA
jgi:outer membrane receptor for ferrienterochelin and colicin